MPTVYRDMAEYVRRAKRVVYQNPWLTFEAHDIVHPNGAAGEHGLVVVAAASAVVALDGDDVLLTRQMRFGANASVIEVVKGGGDDGESELACAQRELREEIGIVAERWEPLGYGWEIPSIMQTPVALFLARDCSDVAMEPEDVESIERIRIPTADVLDMVIRGEIDDGITAVALLRASPYFGHR